MPSIMCFLKLYDGWIDLVLLEQILWPLYLCIESGAHTINDKYKCILLQLFFQLHKILIFW